MSSVMSTRSSGQAHSTMSPYQLSIPDTMMMPTFCKEDELLSANNVASSSPHPQHTNAERIERVLKLLGNDLFISEGPLLGGSRGFNLGSNDEAMNAVDDASEEKLRTFAKEAALLLLSLGKQSAGRASTTPAPTHIVRSTHTSRYNSFRNTYRKASNSSNTDGAMMGTSVASMNHSATVFTNQLLRDEQDGFKTINQYMILQELGRGRFGKVKLAADTKRDDRLVAIKVIARDRVKDHYMEAETRATTKTATTKATTIGGALSVPKNTDRRGSHLSQAMLREVAIMKKLKHPNIVRLHEVIDDPEAAKLYLVMQCVSRGPLLQFDSNGRCATLELEAARRYIRQLCSALHYLQKKNVAHRDIKPDNILLGDDGRVYLSDFGVSSWLLDAEQSKDNTAGLEGTPMFMAPEIFSGCATHDGQAADVWSLGVTFYAMIYGELPFFGATHAEIREAICNDEPRYGRAEEKKSPNALSSENSGVLTPDDDDDDDEIHMGLSYSAGSQANVLAEMMIASMLEKDPAKRATLKDVAAEPFFTTSFQKDSRDPLNKDSLRSGRKSSNSSSSDGGCSDVPTKAKEEDAKSVADEQRRVTERLSLIRPDLRKSDGLSK